MLQIQLDLDILDMPFLKKIDDIFILNLYEIHKLSYISAFFKQMKINYFVSIIKYEIIKNNTLRRLDI